MLDCKPSKIPMDTRNYHNTNDRDLLIDASLYMRLIDHLLYLTLFRPNITFVVHKLSQFMTQSQTTHLRICLFHIFIAVRSSNVPRFTFGFTFFWSCPLLCYRS